MKVVGLLFAFLILLSPTASEAYFTTAQSATRLTNDTVMFTVTYDFGFANRDLYMPIMAARSTGADMKSHLVEFSILSDDEVLTIGTSNALVLTTDSDVKIKNGQYYLEPGESASFTLVALLTIPKEQQLDEKLSLLMTWLPFTMVKDGVEVGARLNPSELQYYRTPEVRM